MERIRKALLPLLAMAILNGCTTYKAVKPPRTGGGPKPYLVGETLRVKTHDGQIFEKRLTHIDPDALVLSDTRVFYKDIDTLETKRKSAAAIAVSETAETTLGILTVAAWLYGFVIAADLLDAAFDAVE